MTVLEAYTLIGFAVSLAVVVWARIDHIWMEFLPETAKPSSAFLTVIFTAFIAGTAWPVLLALLWDNARPRQ